MPYTCAPHPCADLVVPKSILMQLSERQIRFVEILTPAGGPFFLFFSFSDCAAAAAGGLASADKTLGNLYRGICSFLVLEPRAWKLPVILTCGEAPPVSWASITPPSASNVPSCEGCPKNLLPQGLALPRSSPLAQRSAADTGKFTLSP